MPVYDAERYLSAALSSILEQSFTDFEFLIYDDGSRDGSPALLADFSERDPRIRLFTRAHAGHVTWLQEGIATARGELIARMDADDVARPERLARQVEYMAEHPDCIAVGTDAMLIDPESRPIRRLGVHTTHEAIDAALLRRRGDAVLHPSAMFRREALLAAGGYSTRLATAQDLELFLRLAERGRLANVPEVLMDYRQHLSRVSAARAGEQRRTQNEILEEAYRRRGLEAHAANLPPAGPARVSDTEWWRQWALESIRGGNLATARIHAGAVLRAQPLSWRSWELFACAWLGVDSEPWKRALKRALGLRTPVGPGPSAARGSSGR
jgi:glycosyltransferase involved in cell wall biosynthesis